MGFFLAGFPWYFAAIILIFCGNVDQREKPAYILCTIAVSCASLALTHFYHISRLYHFMVLGK